MLTTIIAFSKACRVKISLGLMSSLSRCLIDSPAASHSDIFAFDSAGLDEDPGRVMPITSIAVAMVFAVYIPPQAPPPGQALRMISDRVLSSISPVIN